MQTVRWLVIKGAVEAIKNEVNNNGFTALDILDQYHATRVSDYNTLVIRDILVKAGVLTRVGAAENVQFQRLNIISEANPEEPPLSSTPAILKWLASLAFKKWLRFKISKLDELRGMFVVVATVIASVSFQAIMNPPGGVWQQDTDHTGSPHCSVDRICRAGTSILAYSHTKSYSSFLAYNTLSFFSSLGFILLISAGIPFTNIIFALLLESFMSAAIISMAISFVLAAYQLNPDFLLQQTPYDSFSTEKVNLISQLVGTIILAFVPWSIQFIYAVLSYGNKLPKLLAEIK